MSLTAEQARTVNRAREILDAPSGTELCELAERIGVLEYHLGEMIDVLAEVAS